MKHTPGPWEAKPETDYVPAQVWADGQQLAEVYGESRITRRANAQLMATAPQLLNELQNMLALTQDGWITPEDKPTDWQLGWEAACEQFKIAKTNEFAQAAIRKARGESQ